MPSLCLSLCHAPGNSAILACTANGANCSQSNISSVQPEPIFHVICSPAVQLCENLLLLVNRPIRLGHLRDKRCTCRFEYVHSETGKVADSVELKIGRSAMRMCSMEAGLVQGRSDGLPQNVSEGAEILMGELAFRGPDEGAVAQEAENLLAADLLGDGGMGDSKVDSSRAGVGAKVASELVQVS